MSGFYQLVNSGIGLFKIFFKISDAIFQLNHIYLGRERWYCDDACDANDDGRANLDDVVLIIGYVFFGQIEPIGMERICRADETEDFLGGICECPF